MKIHWPSLTFPPINLWNAPHQPALEDTDMSKVAQPEKLPRIDYVWTHKKKGGDYAITSFTAGDGELHGETLVHYRRLEMGGQGPIYSRILKEWFDTMEPVYR